MKPTIITIFIGFLLVSCQGPTEQEIESMRKRCEANGMDLYVGERSVSCTVRRDPVMDCIKEYTNGLDEKYNNPDTVSNLSDDTYSNAVRTCNEVFGKK